MLRLSDLVDQPIGDSAVFQNVCGDIDIILSHGHALKIGVGGDDGDIDAAVCLAVQLRHRRFEAAVCLLALGGQRTAEHGNGSASLTAALVDRCQVFGNAGAVVAQGRRHVAQILRCDTVLRIDGYFSILDRKALCGGKIGVQRAVGIECAVKAVSLDHSCPLFGAHALQHLLDIPIVFSLCP